MVLTSPELKLYPSSEFWASQRGDIFRIMERINKIIQNSGVWERSFNEPSPMVI